MASGRRVTGAELVGGRVKGPGSRASPKRTPAVGERRLSAAGGCRMDWPLLSFPTSRRLRYDKCHFCWPS